MKEASFLGYRDYRDLAISTTSMKESGKESIFCMRPIGGHRLYVDTMWVIEGRRRAWAADAIQNTFRGILEVYFPELNTTKPIERSLITHREIISPTVAYLAVATSVGGTKEDLRTFQDLALPLIPEVISTTNQFFLTENLNLHLPNLQTRSATDKQNVI